METHAMETHTVRRPIVRELALRRRRSRLPWVYLVYRVHPRSRARRVPPDYARDGGSVSSGSASGGDSVLPAQEGGDVERRIELEHVFR